MSIVSRIVAVLATMAGLGALALFFSAESAVQETSAATLAAACFLLALVIQADRIVGELRKLNRKE